MTTVIVKTYSLTDDTYVEKTIDHDNEGDRRWLGKHCFWALRNGYAVKTEPVT